MADATQSELDHLVFAGPDLAVAVEQIEELLGVTGTPGGAHPGLGTRNVLFSLGSTCYLEVIGPDLEQPEPAQPRPFGIDGLQRPGLVTWAVRPPAGEPIGHWVATLEAHDVHPGPVVAMSRRRPDGGLLEWQLTRSVGGEGGVGRLRPFLIDWGDSVHPSSVTPPGLTLSALRLQHPEPAAVGAAFRALGLEVPVEEGPVFSMIADLQGPAGAVQLR